jgi:serine/threonine protein kinase
MDELAVGADFAGHTILAVAGHGAMGVVYRARHEQLGREVALKVIAPEFADDREFRIRFQREFEAEVSIRHPNIVRVYGAGAKDGRLYVTMQYIDGTDLAALLRNGTRLEPGRAARMIAQVADGLDAAHARGIVHRDVKPANVLIDGDDHCILTDFGLAKNVNTDNAPLTVAGSFLGTCDYAAPEQLVGAQIDARVDVYALGCLLYQAVTGRVPFPRPVSAATMLAHMDEPPPLISAVLPGAPPGLDTVVTTAMAKDPEERYPTAGHLGRAALTATRLRTPG